METLVREPERAGSPAPEAAANGAAPPADASPNGHGGSGGDPAAAPERHCQQCGAAMVASQDWCLECGTAAPGRLGTRPGWRAAATVVGLTLVLVSGAVAASYAALSEDANQQASQPAPPSATPVPQQQAQTPAPQAPAVTPPSLTTPTTSTPSTSTPTTSTPTIPTIPSVPTPTTSVPQTTVTPTQTNTNTNSNTNTQTNENDTSNSNSNDDDSNDTSQGSTGTTQATAITLGADAAAPYDPYGRATEKGDPANAYDGDSDTSWKVVTAADGKEMQVGLVVDLETAKHVSALELETDTPNFRLEVYGSDGSELPADILDTRWTHVASRSKVDRNSTGSNKPNDGKERVVLPKDGDKFRRVLLWFTTPPENATVRISELKLFG